MLDQLDIQNCYSFDLNESHILKNENSYATAYECFAGESFVYILILFYMILVNILLVNLLIAMFRYINMLILFYFLGKNNGRFCLCMQGGKILRIFERSKENNDWMMKPISLAEWDILNVEALKR